MDNLALWIWLGVTVAAIIGVICWFPRPDKPVRPQL